MDLLQLKPGSHVADIGAGGGWFSVRAARRVAPNGRVIAEDINPKAIAYIQQRAKREQLANIETILDTPTTQSSHPARSTPLYAEGLPRSRDPPGACQLRAALKPGARFGIIDRNGKGADHGLTNPLCAPRWNMPAFARSPDTISRRRMVRITS